MLYIFFFILILYLLYNYFFNKNNKLKGGNNDKQIQIKDIDTCIDEINRLADINKICVHDKEYDKGISLCRNINFDTETGKKLLKKHTKTGLFYTLRQNEIKNCPKKKPLVSNRKECFNVVNNSRIEGLICGDNKYYKLALEVCKKTPEHKLKTLHLKDGALFKLIDRVHKKKITPCPKERLICSRLKEEQCNPDLYETVFNCKYENYKCKPNYFDNYDKCLSYLKKNKNLSKKKRNIILNLCKKDDYDKANMYTDIYLNKNAKIDINFNNNNICNDQVNYISNLKDYNESSKNSLLDLCKKGPNGKNKVNKIFHSVVGNKL